MGEKRKMTGDFAVRPWGTWQVLDEGAGYKVKRIEVEPGKRLSYQTHDHRAEHWIIVAGTATCTIEGRTVTAGPGERVYVEIGEAHRITNAHDELLVIVEVQLGEYCGEDDITRLQDDYGRQDAEVGSPDK